MTQNYDSMQQIKWWDRDPFYSKLYEVRPSEPRNKTLAEVYYQGGEFITKVPNRKNVNFEKQIRYMCKAKEAEMRIAVARWVAKKLT